MDCELLFLNNYFGTYVGHRDHFTISQYFIFNRRECIIITYGAQLDSIMFHGSFWLGPYLTYINFEYKITKQEYNNNNIMHRMVSSATTRNYHKEDIIHLYLYI